MNAEKPREIQDLEEFLRINLIKLPALEVGVGNTTFWLDEAGYTIKEGKVIGLSLSGLSGVRDFNFLNHFPYLQLLDLDNTLFRNFEILEQLEELVGISLGRNNISNVGYLSPLTQLKTLYLHNNRIENLEPLSTLSQLSVLYLHSNNIKNVKPLSALSKLSVLYLDDNYIEEVKPLAALNQLESLRLSNNLIKSIPPEFTKLPVPIKLSGSDDIAIEGNPIENPPPEIISQGNQAIIDWWEAQNEKRFPLNEVKVLLVGEGASGKTSLVKRLFDEDFDLHESQTHGIRIRDWSFENSGVQITARLWDFGGQDIMHATHQFFLSKRSLYIFLVDARKDKNMEDHWLKYIESFGGESPVLVVINKIDENPGFNLDRRRLKRKYPGILGFYRLSCKTGEGVIKFRDALESALSEVEMIKQNWAISWFEVKKALETMREPHIDYDQYAKICDDAGIPDGSSRETLVNYLNDLGVALHFDDLAIYNTHVLEPRWITSGVYRIINAPELANATGRLSYKDLPKILQVKKKSDFRFPRAKHAYLMAVMRKFELSYELNENKEALIPNLLPMDSPELSNFDFKNALRFVIQYDFLPPSVMPRFIVKMHVDIESPDLAWRSGVLLKNLVYQTQAVVRCESDSRRMEVFVTGLMARDYLTVIRHVLLGINNGFKKIDVREGLPCRCNECRHLETPYVHQLPLLYSLKQKGFADMPCPNLHDVLAIDEILGDTINEKPSLEQIKDSLDQILSKLDKKDPKYVQVAGWVSSVVPGLKDFLKSIDNMVSDKEMTDYQDLI